MTTPFTYLITHRSSGLQYYGVRYSKNCHPSNLWSTYFTSSKIVHTMIEQDGKDAFDVQIRKTFNTAEEAVMWEFKVLKRLKVTSNSKWINQSYGGKCCNTSEKFSEETKYKMRLAKLGKPSGRKGKPCSEEDKQLKRQKMLGRSKPDSQKAKLSAIASTRYKYVKPDGSWTWRYTTKTY